MDIAHAFRPAATSVTMLPLRAGAENQEVTVAEKHDEQDGMTRREFASRVGAAAAGIAIGGNLFESRAYGGPFVGSPVLGANDPLGPARHRAPGPRDALERGVSPRENGA